MKQLLLDDPEVAKLVEKEEARINDTIDLIASESYAPRSVMEAIGSIFTSKAVSYKSAMEPRFVEIQKESWPTPCAWPRR